MRGCARADSKAQATVIYSVVKLRKPSLALIYSLLFRAHIQFMTFL